MKIYLFKQKMAILSRRLILLAPFYLWLYEQYIPSRWLNGRASALGAGSRGFESIPKALKWYQWLPRFVLSIIRQALTSLLLTNIAQLTSQHLQKVKKSEKSLIIINVCIHRRTVWKIGSHAKYVILLKYRDYY